ncbi:MAG: hypothetical protein WCI76_02470 [bacterium]
MTDIELNTLIKTYTDYVQNLSSKIELNKDGPVKQARRRKHLAVLELKLNRAEAEKQKRVDRSYWGR